MEFIKKQQNELLEIASIFKTSCSDALQKVEQQGEALREAKRVIEQYKAKESSCSADDILKSAKQVGSLHAVAAKVDCCDANALRKLGDVLRDKDSSVVAVVAAVNDDKITFQCVCGKDAVACGVKAGDIIKNITAIAGGKGGGKPDSAMGGGNDVSKLNEALAAVERLVAEKI